MKKIWTIFAVAILLLVILYFILPFFQNSGENIEMGDVNIPVPESANISMATLYWGDYESPVKEGILCSNETKNSNLSFVVEINTEISATSYDECIITNNENVLETEKIEGFDNYIGVTAIAETDRENNIQACCEFEGDDYCTEIEKLYVCPLE